MSNKLRGMMSVAALACGLIAAAGPAWAGSTASSVKIVSVALNRSLGYGFVKFETPPGGKPACSSHYWDYTVPLSTPFDDKLYATLLAAFEAGNAVTVYGTGLCSEHGNIESVDSVQLVP